MHGRARTGAIESNVSTDVELTINRKSDVREVQGKCSYDGMGVGRPPRTESAHQYEQFPTPSRVSNFRLERYSQ